MTPRFYCPPGSTGPLAKGAEIALPREAAHHADRVLRMRVGDALCIFDGEGLRYSGQLTATGREVRMRIDAVSESASESPLDITLVQALAVADKMDWIVQKAVELGVNRVQPVAAERSVLRLDGDRAAKRVAHWQQVAQSAAEQCGRDRLTAIAPVSSLPAWLGGGFAGERWILDPVAGTSLRDRAAPTGPVALLIGPEGGWSEAELAAARTAGCTPITLGPRVLRTETAGLATVAAMLALWGDF
ncbi:16S rRNA (uracil(1498)-N(3))-methyltransferase [Uliginosibacterium sp. sgz301328]|uniref:16S rRNA (uracil(1498)-N(3))-methyltransferase n=1 Tax=Uliginosibacterium sp. sgz301328 TaxID=3243764 RepID=UPI00359CCAD4